MLELGRPSAVGTRTASVGSKSCTEPVVVLHFPVADRRMGLVGLGLVVPSPR